MPLLTFPMTRQATPATCGPSAVQGLLYYYGIEKREDELIEALGATEEGVSLTSILAYLKSQGLRTTNHSMSLGQVLAWIDRRVPVLLCIQAWSDDGHTDYTTTWGDGHYVVAVGYDTRNLIIEDPSLLGNRGFIPFEELPSRWHDLTEEGQVLQQYGVAVWGPRPVYDPRKMIHIAIDRVVDRWLRRA